MKKETYKIMNNQELNHWWYKGRRHLIKALLKKYIGGKKILDIGCGTGTLAKELEHNYDYYGIDISQDAINYCKDKQLNNCQFGDITKIPHKNEEFDGVYALDVLEHIQDDAVAAKELHRVLKDDGILILFVPAFKILWGWSDVYGQHHRRYTKKTLIKVLKENGFRIRRFSYFNTVLFLPILAVRLVGRLSKKGYVNEMRESKGMVNAILSLVFRSEVEMMQWINYPFGVSAMVVAEKKS